MQFKLYWTVYATLKYKFLACLAFVVTNWGMHWIQLISQCSYKTIRRISEGFTDEDEDADQQRDESTGAERGWHDVGRGVAGLNGSVRVTAAHMDGEGPRAAEGRRAAVHHQDGQQIHVLLLPVESGALRPDARCVVYRVRETKGLRCKHTTQYMHAAIHILYSNIRHFTITENKGSVAEPHLLCVTLEQTLHTGTLKIAQFCHLTTTVEQNTEN